MRCAGRRASVSVGWAMRLTSCGDVIGGGPEELPGDCPSPLNDHPGHRSSGVWEVRANGKVAKVEG